MAPSPSSLSAFAAIGLALALGYLLMSSASAGMVLFARSRRAAAAGLRSRAGEFVARELTRVDRRLSRLGTAGLLFLSVFTVLVALGRHDAWPAVAPWLPPAIAALIAATAAFALAKTAALLRYRRRLGLLLEADLRVATRLEEVQLRGHRVFHAVAIGNRVIDHVIVGATGLFAMQLILPPRSGAATVTLMRGSLIFGPDHGEFRLQPVIGAFALLAKEIGRVVGHPVKVVPTVVAPGCKVSAWDDDRYLLTNEQNCVTLVGWKDTAAYLMDDEVARISDWVAARCQPQPWLAWRGASHDCISRPALL